MRRLSSLVLIGLFLGVAASAAHADGAVFPDPPELQPQVDFWTRVYTEVGTDGGLLHDADDLGVVYEVIRFPDGLSARAERHRVRHAERLYKHLLLRLAHADRDDLGSLSAEERRVLALFPPQVSSRTLRHAAYNVRFQRGQADKFRAGLIRAGAYEPHIRRVFAAEGVPSDLAALPHVESSYNPDAVSKVGAAGLWQFTRSTGRRFLRIDSVVDERFDPFRSSEAAAALLHENYEKTGTWPLAVTAYNSGAAGMLRAVRDLGTRKIGRIVTRYDSRTFGFASRNFYTEFLAALHVERNARRYFGPLERLKPPREDVVVLNRYYPARILARTFGVNLDVLRTLNPALRAPVWRGRKYVPRGFALRLPGVSNRPAPEELLASVTAGDRFAHQRPDRVYRVRRGDTLSGIAARYGISARTLARMNGLRSRHWIRAGQRLRLPLGSEGPAVTSARSVQTPLAPGAHYTVHRGDTLWTIARRAGLSALTLAQANGITSPRELRAGRVLEIPDRNAPAKTAPAAPTQTASAAPAAPAAAAPSDADDQPSAPVAESGDSSQSPDAADLADPAVSGDAANDLGALASGATDSSDGASDGATLLELDPSRYIVSSNGTIVVQPGETLGHYAEWLEIPTSRLRHLNRRAFHRALVIGHRLRLDFRRVSPQQFEQRRLAYHRALREKFLRRNRIAGTEEHVLRRGETLWELSRRRYGVPVWLLRDYNPDLDLSSLRAGVRVTIPRIEPKSS